MSAELQNISILNPSFQFLLINGKGQSNLPKQLEAPLRSNRPCILELCTRLSNVMMKTFVACLQGFTLELLKTFTGLDEILATALLNDVLFVTMSNQAEVFVYNTTSLQPMDSITFDGLGNFLWSLAADAANNCLYISDLAECSSA